MATTTTHGFPAPGHNTAPVSMGTQHLQTFLNMYFNPNYVRGTERRDHFQLAEASRDQIFEDAGKVIRNISIEHLMWINTQLLPARVTRKLEMEVTVIRFDRGAGPEQTPNEAVSRYIDIQRETVSFRSKRYGMAMYFEVDRMMTPEGQEEFALFAKEIAKRFRQHAAYVAMARFLQPHATDQMWYPQYGAHPQNITEDQIRREVAEFAAPHKSEAGAFQLIWTYAKAFERLNGIKPDFVIFHSEKQALFKFNNKLLNEYYRGGPEAPGRILDPEEIANIQGMSFREFPVFPAQCYNSMEDAENSMNSQDVEIGNFFVFRRSAFDNVPEFRNGVHNYIEIFSENKDGMYRIHEREILRNSGRFNDDGTLHGDHDELAQSERPVKDIFIYEQDREKRVAKFLGEISPEYLTDDLIDMMVRDTLRGIPNIDEVRLQAEVFRYPVDELNEGNRDGKDAAYSSLIQFFAHLMRRLGGNNNDFSNDRLRLWKCGVLNSSGSAHKQEDIYLIWIQWYMTYHRGTHALIDQLFAVINRVSDGNKLAVMERIIQILLARPAEPLVVSQEIIQTLQGDEDEFELDALNQRFFTNDEDEPSNQLDVRARDVIQRYPDLVERAVALAILNTSIHRDVFETMLSFNIQLPFDYLILRPFHDLLMSNMTLAKGGVQLGETLIGYGHTGIGWKVVNKTGDLHCTQWMGAYIRDYGLRCIIRNAFHERSYGGGGHKFFTEDEYKRHVENGFHTEGYDRPSLLGLIIPVGSYVKDDFLHLAGQMYGGRESVHYATRDYYQLHYQFSKIPNDRPTVVYGDAGSPRTNVICFQGTQRQCGNINGDPGVITENKGHLGIERTGDREVRCHGLKLKPVLNGQQVTA